MNELELKLIKLYQKAEDAKSYKKAKKILKKYAKLTK
tara:strand:- start:151 stop:261 length:111 start_codon:yes stop_codon:yes gene_type:complete